MQGGLDPLVRSQLPEADNVNPYCFSLGISDAAIIQKGKMIAYYGQLKFEGLGQTAYGNFVGQHFNSPLYAGDFVVVSGQGTLLLGDRGFDLNSYDIEAGNLTIRAGNLLGYRGNLELKQSIIPGFLTLVGTGTMIAASHGPVHFVEPPARVDPQALMGWADCPSPCHHYDRAYMSGVMGAIGSMLGHASGEEHQYDFTGAGTILMQSSETVVDDNKLMQQLDGQTAGLGLGSMQQLHTKIGQRIQAQQQSGY